MYTKYPKVNVNAYIKTHICFSHFSPAANHPFHFLMRIPFLAYVPAADRRKEIVICGTVMEQSCSNNKFMSWGNNSITL